MFQSKCIKFNDESNTAAILYNKEVSVEKCLETLTRNVFANKVQLEFIHFDTMQLIRSFEYLILSILSSRATRLNYKSNWIYKYEQCFGFQWVENTEERRKHCLFFHCPEYWESWPHMVVVAKLQLSKEVLLFSK